MLIRKTPERAWKAFPAFVDVRGAGHDVRKTTSSPDTQPMQLIIRERAIFGALLISHGSEHEPVPHRRSATERQRLEQGICLKRHAKLYSVDGGDFSTDVFPKNVFADLARGGLRE